MAIWEDWGSPKRYTYYCDDCVPRGCNCNAEYVEDFGSPDENKKWKWLEEGVSYCYVDELGREFPCCEFHFDEMGFVVEDDEVAFFMGEGVTFYIGEYDDFSKEQEYQTLKTICGQIYIARNISLSEADLLTALKKIDAWGREENTN